MNFWSWINKNYEAKNERFGYGKRITVGVIVFLLIPILIYQLIIWNPTLGIDEEGEVVKLGVYCVIGLYWFALYLDYKRYEAKKRLTQMLDRIFTEDDTEFDKTIALIKNKRKLIMNDAEKDYRNEGEERLKWFGIK